MTPTSWIERQEGVKYSPTVNFSPDPSFNFHSVCTVPLPKLCTPITTARLFCFNAAATISEAEALPRLISKTNGIFNKCSATNKCFQSWIEETVVPLVLTIRCLPGKNKSLTRIACSSNPPGLLRKSRIKPWILFKAPSLFISS